jgi:hypothetical protein
MDYAQQVAQTLERDCGGCERIIGPYSRIPGLELEETSLTAEQLLRLPHLRSAVAR